MYTVMNMISITIVIIYVLYASLERVIDGKARMLARVAALVVLVAAVWLAVHRDTYLPFLAPTALPHSLIIDPDNDIRTVKSNVHTTVKVDAPDGTKVAFWGALPSNEVKPSPQDAYSDYSNAGVTLVQNGMASISFFCPAKYTVPWGKTLDRHIHYRVINKSGMISEVKTVFVNC